MLCVIPKNPSEDKGDSRKHIGHGNSKGCCCVLHPQKVQILVNNWPDTYKISTRKVKLPLFVSLKKKQ